MYKYIKSKDIEIEADGNITQNADGKTIEATGGNITLTSNNGNIGTPNGTALGFSLTGSGTINADAQNNGSVVLKGYDTDINTSSIKAKNDIDLTTVGNGSISVSDNITTNIILELKNDKLKDEIKNDIEKLINKDMTDEKKTKIVRKIKGEYQ